MKAASDDMVRLIDYELKQFPENIRNTSRIFIGGVAQGGMLALSTFMRYPGPEPLGGVFSLLGYEPLPVKHMLVYKKAIKWQANTPLLLYNGTKDKLAPAIFVKDTYLHFDAVYKEGEK